jgi:hypothetical protein
LEPSIGGCVGVENGIAFFILSCGQLNSHDWAFGFIRERYYQLLWVLDWRSWIDGSVVSVSLWAPALAVITVTAAAWWADARARLLERAERCAECKYDRAGLLADSVCPECGRVVLCDTSRV